MSEMPEEIKEIYIQNSNFVESVAKKNHLSDALVDLWKDGFDKCFELMIEREAKLKAQLDDAIKALRAVNKVGLTHYEDCPVNIEDCEVCTCGIEAIMNQVWNAIEGAGNE